MSSPLFTAPIYPRVHGQWVTRLTPRLRWVCNGVFVPQRVDTAIALDEPLSVIPLDVFRTFQVAVNFDLPQWVGSEQKVPPWRGMPCRIGIARMVLVNPSEHPPEGGYRSETLDVLVRVPLQDPVAPPPHILLGNEFFIHYSSHLHIRFGVLHISTWPPAIDYNVGEFVLP